MTVEELRQYLQDLPPEMPVVTRTNGHYSVDMQGVGVFVDKMEVVSYPKGKRQVEEQFALRIG